MDAEHERCAAALETLRQDLKPASLAAVLKEVETHFAHEEELLDRYVYKQPGGGGFSADAGARKSHRADHTKILSEIRAACERAEREGTVPMEIVTRVEDEFERHADQFDGKTHGSLVASGLHSSKSASNNRANRALRGAYVGCDCGGAPRCCCGGGQAALQRRLLKEERRASVAGLEAGLESCWPVLAVAAALRAPLVQLLDRLDSKNLEARSPEGCARARNDGGGDLSPRRYSLLDRPSSDLSSACWCLCANRTSTSLST